MSNICSYSGFQGNEEDMCGFGSISTDKQNIFCDPFTGKMVAKLFCDSFEYQKVKYQKFEYQKVEYQKVEYQKIECQKVQNKKVE